MRVNISTTIFNSVLNEETLVYLENADDNEALEMFKDLEEIGYYVDILVIVPN